MSNFESSQVAERVREWLSLLDFLARWVARVGAEFPPLDPELFLEGGPR